MKSATIPEIKKVLSVLEPNELVELCLRMAKYKKENKELLNYLLFEASDELLFLKKVKQELDELFDELAQSNNYLIKKSLRKILKTTNKHIKYANSKTIEVDLLLFFCLKMVDKGFSSLTLALLSAIFESQFKKIEKAIATMHEDLQYDYRIEVEKLRTKFI